MEQPTEITVFMAYRQNHTLNACAALSQGARVIIFCLSLHLLSYFVHACECTCVNMRVCV